MRKTLCSTFLAAVVALALSGCGTITYDLGSETLPEGTTSGVYDETDPYVVGLLQCRADLMPPVVEAVPGTAGNFFDVVSAQFPAAAGWSYTSATRRLSRRTIRVRTHDVLGSAAVVGVEFHVNYRPRRRDPSTRIHWIQVYDNNHDSRGGHGVRGNRVDVPAAATTPYYDDGYAATNGTCAPTCYLYDRPFRTDTTRDHTWQAVTFLVQGPDIGAGPGAITFLRPGFRWGWTNSCRGILDYLGWILFSEERVTLAADRPFAPGAEVRVSLPSPIELELSRRDERTSVELQDLSFQVRIEELPEVFSEGEAAVSRFTVVQGSGRLGEIAMESVRASGIGFEIAGGEGAVQWDSGELSLQLELDMGGELPNLVASGFGQLGPEGRSLVLDTGFQAVEPDLAREAAAKGGDGGRQPE